MCIENFHYFLRKFFSRVITPGLGTRLQKYSRCVLNDVKTTFYTYIININFTTEIKAFDLLKTAVGRARNISMLVIQNINLPPLKNKK